MIFEFVAEPTPLFHAKGIITNYFTIINADNQDMKRKKEKVNFLN